MGSEKNTRCKKTKEMFPEDAKVKKSLREIVKKIVMQQNEKALICRDIAESYKTAKNEGFNCVVIKKIIQIKKKDQDDLQEQDFLFEMYNEILDEEDA